MFNQPSSSTLPPPKHDSTSIKLAKVSIDKDLLIGILDVRVYELENENSQKSKQISDLQPNIGGLTTLYFDLKEILIGNFGDEFKTSGSNDGKALETSERVVVNLAPDYNLDQFMSSSLVIAE
ncbi:unnamed protein product [Lactuca saligna]|uniref:Uncharacterized protein n=1 Tax=Lactuca saligna TaxID=75948 RepID=A0AA35V1P6_LACSI|nr:unnamed protein product [Lactuca saligna]